MSEVNLHGYKKSVDIQVAEQTALGRINYIRRHPRVIRKAFEGMLESYAKGSLSDMLDWIKKFRDGLRKFDELESNADRTEVSIEKEVFTEIKYFTESLLSLANLLDEIHESQDFSHIPISDDDPEFVFSRESKKMLNLLHKTSGQIAASIESVLEHAKTIVSKDFIDVNQSNLSSLEHKFVVGAEQFSTASVKNMLDFRERVDNVVSEYKEGKNLIKQLLSDSKSLRNDISQLRNRLRYYKERMVKFGQTPGDEKLKNSVLLLRNERQKEIGKILHHAKEHLKKYSHSVAKVFLHELFVDEQLLESEKDLLRILELSIGFINEILQEGVDTVGFTHEKRKVLEDVLAYRGELVRIINIHVEMFQAVMEFYHKFNQYHAVVENALEDK